MSASRQATALQAVIFDMDGVLLDSEPLWQLAEIETFRALGVPMTLAMCHETMGTRADEVVRYWHARYPWSTPSVDAVEASLIDRVETLLRRDGKKQAAPGLERALAAPAAYGLAVGLASSSAMRLIEAVLATLAIGDSFSVVHSAEHEVHGKPHPAVYLHTAQLLGVAAQACVAVEDSVPGLIAAKAARMHCVMIPDPALRGDPRLGLADAVLSGLDQLPEYLAGLLVR